MTLAIVAAFVVAAAGTGLMIRLAPALRMIDRPNDRSSHETPTSRGGGLAIVVAMTTIGLCVTPRSGALHWALLAALPVAVLGLLDDLFRLSARLRLGVQVLVSAVYVTAIAGGYFNRVEIMLFILAIAWCCNLFNFMDGIDGIAGMEALFISALAGWFVWPLNSELATGLWLVSASSAGFLLWNWAPARIFMGDVGSSYLGFLIAAIACVTMVHGLVALPVWIILWSLFLADTAATLTRRMLGGEKWWMAHRSHAYQHLSARFGSHARVTLIYAAINIALVTPSAWYAFTHPGAAWWTCALLMLGLVAVAYLLGAGRPNSASRLRA